MRALAATAALLGWLAAPASAAWIDGSLSGAGAAYLGEAEGDRSGTALACTGDVDGDGLDDLLIGASAAGGDGGGGAGPGRTYLVLGRTTWSVLDDLSAADAVFTGMTAGDQAGLALAGGGDVDGDGRVDLLIGAPGTDAAGADAGTVYLLLGRPPTHPWDGEIPLTEAEVRLQGEAAMDRAGLAVALAGDVDGDGLDDLLIGAPGNDEAGDAAGQCYLVFGREGGWPAVATLGQGDASFLGEAGGDELGLALAGGGDVDGDGVGDLLIGAPGAAGGVGPAAGVVYLVRGDLAAGLDWTPDMALGMAAGSFVGEALGDRAGEAVALPGDVDGDGLDDLLIGAPANDERGEDAGQVYLVLGRPFGWTLGAGLADADASWWGEEPGDRAGHAVAGAGDMDGDGLAEVVIGAPNNGFGGVAAGQAYLILGQQTAWVTDVHLEGADGSFWGEDPHDRAGQAVAGGADLDGDGFDDLLVGAPGRDEGGGSASDPADGAGKSYLIGISCPDHDGDGFPAETCGGEDCDDEAAGTHPDAAEDCADGADNDCDGAVDGEDEDCGGGSDPDGWLYPGTYLGGGIVCAATDGGGGAGLGWLGVLLAALACTRRRRGPGRG